MATEIELKLEVDPRHLERLRRHAAVQEFKQGRAVTRTLTSVYFDTPQHHLHAAGTSLRVRHIGARRIQAVKTRLPGGSCGSGHLSRGEWEQDISGDEPDMAALRAAGLGGLNAKTAAQGLRPIFVTRFRRAAYMLSDGAWEIELTLDKGAVETDHGSAPICEAELELKRGRPADLYTVARRLARDVPLRVALDSKADRGYSLATGGTRQPVKAAPLSLRPEMTAAETFQAIGRSCLRHLLYNEPALRTQRAPEAVHQMRVALRRLRSAITLFKPLVAGAEGAAVVAELKWVTGELGPARDLDVFIAEILRPVADASPNDAGLAGLVATFEARRAAAYERALAAIAAPRFMQMVLEVAAWLEAGDWLSPEDEAARAALAEPVAPLAGRILAARHARVLKKGRRFARLDPERRHRVRIEVKKLRYAADFFASLYGRKKTKAFAKSMTALQEHLGALNDVAVAGHLLHDLVHEQDHAAPHPEVRERAFAAGQVAGWHRARVEGPGAGVLDAATRAWKGFTRTKVFWG